VPHLGDEIRLSGITKRFGGLVANAGIDLTLRRGEIHALLGENGAGKSTLMNILSGVYQPDEGVIVAGGERLRLRSPRDAVRLGIGMVHQHFQLIDAFSVLDNVLLATGGGSFRLDRRGAAQRLVEVSRRHGLTVTPDAPVWQLTVGERQRVEIVKLLYRGAELLLLDEPTAVLTPAEAEDLYRALRQLAEAGKFVVFITHKLNEVIAAADRITVLRQGRVVTTLDRAAASIAVLGMMMVGTTPGRPHVATLGEPGTTVLSLENAWTKTGRGASGLKGVELALRRGEILGIAGVAGNGQVELAEAIAGIRTLRRGRVWLDGADVTRRCVLDRLRAGLRFVPEDRLGMGLVPQLDLADNVMLRDFREPPLARGPWIDRRVARARTRQLVRDYDVRPSGIETKLRALSGGNQQKILIGRELLSQPIVLVVAQPTRGLDVTATRAVHDRLLALRAAGTGVLLISEDLDEVLLLSDRVAVLYDGEIRSLCTRAEANRGSIGTVMGGHLLEPPT
jgi:simple sugar transport system ATP-binding protein